MSPQTPNSWLDTIDNAIGYADSNESSREKRHWMRHSIAIGNLWSPSDTENNCKQFEESCGLMAFAATTGMTMSNALQLFPQSTNKKWINRKEMCVALERVGFRYAKIDDGQWPRIGLSLIHFIGPWTDTGYPAAILQHSHWVGVIGEYIFDVNWLGWLPRTNWSEIVAEQLVKARPNAHGWSLLSSYEFLRSA